jgi:hypothetical protein
MLLNGLKIEDAARLRGHDDRGVDLCHLGQRSAIVSSCHHCSGRLYCRVKGSHQIGRPLFVSRTDNAQSTFSGGFHESKWRSDTRTASLGA